VPAGDAAETLSLAARQGGLEIIFFAETVRGVRTPQLRGSFIPRDALTQLLAGTGLLLVADELTGTITIRRTTSVSPTSIPEPPSRSSSPTSSSMNVRRPLAALGAWLSLAVTGSTQTVVPPTEEAAASAEPVKLSPFEVVTDRDVGFVPATSLAGGRLSTDLKQTPLAYSVLTKELIETLDLVDTEKAMEWTVNSVQVRDDGADRFGNTDGGSRSTVRGVGAKVLRNFFEIGRFGDTYNQDRIDIARGANALLIGNGGLGGALVMLTKQARFDRITANVSLRGSNHGARRAVVDYNQPLGGKFAFRGVLLRQDSDTWRHRVFDRRDGEYATLAFRPFKKTTLRLDYENYRQRELGTLTHFNDFVSGWDGATVLDAPTATLANSNARGVRVYTTTPLIVPARAPNTVVNYANSWRTMGGAETAETPINGVLAINTAPGASGSYMSDVENEPRNRYTLATANSAFRLPSRADVAAPRYPTFQQYLRNTSAFLDQQIGQDVFVQASFSETKSGRALNFLGNRLANMYIDVNRRLPTGEVNPFFLQPYVETTTRDNTNDSVDNFTEYRLAAAWLKDRTRLGSFKLSAIAGRTNRYTEVRAYTLAMARNPDIRQRPFTDGFGYRYYVNDSYQSYAPVTEVRFIDPVAGANTTYAVQNLLDLNGTNPTAERTFEFLQAGGSALLFRDRLSLIAGARQDRFRQKSWNSRANPRTSYPTDWDGTTYFTNPAAPANYFDLNATQRALYNPPDTDQRERTVSAGSVLHLAEWASVFYNYAETFDTSRSLQDITGRIVAPVVSHGTDAGLRLRLFSGRINFSYTRYETVQNNSLITPPSVLSPILEANALGDTDPQGRNRRGLEPLPSGYSDYFDRRVRGHEFEITANVTRGWRLTYNLAFPESLSAARYQDTWAYIGANENTLRQIVLDTGATIGATGVAAVPTGFNLATSPDIATAANAWNTLQDFKRTNDPSLQITNNLHKFTTNFYSDYRLQSGRLKGLRFGAGVQYRSKIQIGNRANDTIVNPANPLTAIDDPAVDGNTPVYMSAYHLVTGTAGYEFTFRQKLRLTLKLNIENLLDEDRVIYYGTSLRPRGGDIRNPSRVAGGGVHYFITPRTFSLSATLSY
jgi:outer membrane receptor for ferric coprogen and ferric-rhodotorulic acid